MGERHKVRPHHRRRHRSRWPSASSLVLWSYVMLCLSMVYIAIHSMNHLFAARHAVPKCSYSTLNHVSEEEIYTHTSSAYWLDVRDASRSALSAAAQEKLNLNGFVLLRGLLDSDVVRELRQHIVEGYGHESLEIPDLRGIKIGDRFDVHLDLEDGIVAKALVLALQTIKPLYDKLVGAHGELVELSCMFTCNSPSQKTHTDLVTNVNHKTMYPSGNCSAMFSTFIALQPTPGYLGATRVLPKSHFEGNEIECTVTEKGPKTMIMNRENEYRMADGFCNPPMLNATLGPGDALIYNSYIFHQAGENSLDLARMMFYYTLKSKSPFPAVGSTFSINDKYKRGRQVYVSDELLNECIWLEEQEDFIKKWGKRIMKGALLQTCRGLFDLSNLTVARTMQT